MEREFIDRANGKKDKRGVKHSVSHLIKQHAKNQKDKQEKLKIQELDNFGVF